MTSTFDPDPFGVHETDTDLSSTEERKPVDRQLLEGLNPEQGKAVELLDGPLLVVAGPGSGKTRVLTHRIAALLQTNTTQAHKVLAMTFTNKAAGEMKERLEELLGDETGSRMWVCTFHSFCARILRIEHKAAGLPQAYSIVDSNDVKSILKEILREQGKEVSAEEVRSTVSQISRVKNQGGEANQVLLQVYDAYQKRLRQLGALDFDDLLLETLKLFEKDKEVLEKYQRRFSHILVDEYQDTNPVQYNIIRLLAYKHRNLCVVGDADQAIYGFRSASPEAMLGFTDDWAEAQVVVLETNYRSTPEIIEVCSALIEANPAKHRPALNTINPSGEPVRLLECRSDTDEAGFVVQEMKENLNATQAVLVRTNAQTRKFEEKLMQAAIPYSVVGTLKFYDRAEVKDALSYLRFIANPLDVLSLARSVTAPRRGIGAKTLTDFIEAAEGRNLLEFLKESVENETLARGAKSWAAYWEHLEKVVQAAEDNGPADAIVAVVQHGLRGHVEATEKEKKVDKLENLQELAASARNFQENPELDELEGWEKTLKYLEHVALISSVDIPEGSQNPKVELMTVHASKGKEFDSVYVVGVEENYFPHERSTKPKELEEERRLLFVACSRARAKLSLSFCKERYTYAGVENRSISRFLKDLPSTVKLQRVGFGTQSTLKVHNTFVEPVVPFVSRSNHTIQRKQSRKPVEEGPRLNYSEIEVGTKIVHKKFGEGVIVNVGTEEENTVTAEFEGKARYMLRLDLAPISKVSEK